MGETAPGSADSANQALCALAELTLLQDFPENRPSQIVCPKTDADGRLCGATARYIRHNTAGSSVEFATLDDWGVPCFVIAEAFRQPILGGITLDKFNQRERSEQQQDDDHSGPTAA